MLPEPKYKVELGIENKAHFYQVNGGIKLPGVTGYLQVIAKPALIPWAQKETLNHVKIALEKRLKSDVAITSEWIEEILVEAKKRPTKIKDDAADFGTQVHIIIDSIIKGQELKLSQEFEPPVNAFKEWLSVSGIKIVAGDTKVASLKKGFGGSLDAIGIKDGKYIVLDWKSSNGIWPEYALQVSAYVRAFNETYDADCGHAIIVRFGKKLPIEFEVKEVENIQDCWYAFECAMGLKRSLENGLFIA